MRTYAIYALAAFCEIAGCFSFWAWLKMGKSVVWIAPGIITLALFAFLLTLVDAPGAGRVYAGYGAIYIASSIVWLWLVEKQAPDWADIGGAAICLIGAAVIMFGRGRIVS
jgi:small multidrug resistance family-3 protein